jgi:hypothetical protein
LDRRSWLHQLGRLGPGFDALRGFTFSSSGGSSPVVARCRPAVGGSDWRQTGRSVAALAGDRLVSSREYTSPRPKTKTTKPIAERVLHQLGHAVDRALEVPYIPLGGAGRAVKHFGRPVRVHVELFSVYGKFRSATAVGACRNCILDGVLDHRVPRHAVQRVSAIRPRSPLPWPPSSRHNLADSDPGRPRSPRHSMTISRRHSVFHLEVANGVLQPLLLDRAKWRPKASH